MILGDEINRAPPKVQSALLEAMQERQVTAGGETRPLPEVFVVIATQNPIEHEGTYPLPEAQLDRFFMKVNLDYPEPDQELEILHRQQQRLTNASGAPVAPPLSREQLLAARDAVNRIHMDEMLERYAIALVGATRAPGRYLAGSDTWLERGASPRATLALARAARARAFLCGRDFVEPGDIMNTAGDILNHRLGLTFSARAEGLTARGLVDQLLEAVPVP